MSKATLLENTISQEDKKQIITLYQQNCSLRQIEKEVGYSRSAVSKMLERLNIKTTKGNHYRKYFFNFDFFEVIDTPNKAYWLGFLYADGCILSSKYGEQSFKLALAEQDKEILEKFKQDLSSSYPIRYDNSKNIKNKKWQRQCLIEMRSQKAVNDLKKLGCVERKSLILNFPSSKQVPNEYIYHFIRGYFDGDGSISYYKKKNSYTLSFVGTELFIKSLSNYFLGGSVFADSRKTNSWYFTIGGNKQIVDAYYKIYKDANGLYLKRKHDKFQQLLLKYSES